MLGKVIKPLAGIILLLFGLIAALGLSFLMMVVTRFVHHSEFQGMIYTLDSILAHFPLHQFFVFLGFILFVGIPLFQLIYLGLRMLFNMAKQSGVVKGTLAGLWILGFFFMIFFGFFGGVNFSEDARIEITRILEEVETDTLRISLNGHDNFFWDERNMRIEETEDGKYKLISDVKWMWRGHPIPSITYKFLNGQQRDPIEKQKITPEIFPIIFLQIPGNFTWTNILKHLVMIHTSNRVLN